MARTLFVYGSLKRGEPNHWLIQRQGCQFIRVDQTTRNYDLWQIGCLPVMVQDGDSVIWGEVWTVPDRAWSSVRKIERGHIEAEITLRSGEPATAFVQTHGFITRMSDTMVKMRKIESGRWSAFGPDGGTLEHHKSPGSQSCC